MSEKNHDRKRDIKRLARMLRDGSYNYNQTKSLISDARELAGLTRPADKKGSVDRLNPEEFGKLMEVAYEKSGTHGLMIRTLLQTGSRVEAFT